MFDISLNEFNTDWTNKFRKEAEKIHKLFLDDDSILHIGSTSIPNMVANEVIDMAIFVNELLDSNQYCYLLSKLDYTETGFFSQEDWLIFANGTETFHLHIGSYTSEAMVRLLLFKLFLCRHEDYRELYLKIKKYILENAEKSLYEINKKYFVDRVIFLAQLEILSGTVQESDMEILYANAITTQKEKINAAILEFCEKNREELQKNLKNYSHLHEKLKTDSMEKVMNSPLLRKFQTTNMNGEIVVIGDSKEGEFIKNIMTETLVRNYFSFASPEMLEDKIV